MSTSAVRMSRPCVWTVPSSLKTLYVADLNKDDQSQRRAAFQLITDAAQRADNVGVDEFTQEWFDLMMYFAEVTVTLSEPQKRPGCLLGLLVVTPSRFCRSQNPSTCQVLMFTAKELGGRQTWRDLARLGTTLVAEAKRPYAACVAEVFVPCLDRVLALRDEGLVITACLPEAGVLAGHSGHCDSYIMYKTLDLHDISKFMLTVADPEDDEEADSISFTLRDLPRYLPAIYEVDGGQTQILVRPLRRDEVPDFYSAVKEAAASGKGYGYDELPSLSHFIRYYIDGFRNVVFELATSNGVTAVPRNSGKPPIIGYMNFGPSLRSRSRNQSAIVDGNVVLRPEFRGRRWSAGFLRIGMGLLAECGFRCIVGDTTITNLAVITVNRSLGNICCGTIPRGIYLPDHGWVDLLVHCRSIGSQEAVDAKRMLKSKI